MQFSTYDIHMPLVFAG